MRVYKNGKNCFMLSYFNKELRKTFDVVEAQEITNDIVLKRLRRSKLYDYKN